MISGIEKARIAIGIVALIAMSAAFLQMGFAYSTAVQNTGGVSAEYMAIDLSNDFNNDAVLSTDEVTSLFDDFTAEVTSTVGEKNTVILVTVEDRSALANIDVVKFRVSSTIQGVKHSAGFVLTVTSTADSTPTITAADGAIVSGSIGAKTGSGAYTFNLEVTGMESRSTAKASAALTQYIMNKTDSIGPISGTEYSGRAVGNSTLTVFESATASSLEVELSSTGFTDLGESGWIYILSVTSDGNNFQYAYSTDGSAWSYASNGALVLTQDTEYTATLYLAGAGDSSHAYAWEDVPRTDGTVITDGAIKFTHTPTQSEEMRERAR